MLKRVIVVIVAALVLLLSGCASNSRMAFSNDTDVISKSGKPIFLMSVTLKNSYKNFQPKLSVVRVDRAVQIDGNPGYDFGIDEKAKNEVDTAEAGNSYLLRMELENGEYVIRGLTSNRFAGLVYITFYTPLNLNLKSAGSGVFYVGHVDATIRERKETEFRAGPTVPLLDQAVGGASGGTFDVVVSDKWDSDKQKFTSKFPVLNSVEVKKNILPAFDRVKVQKWFDGL
jgi:hypothetical protein